MVGVSPIVGGAAVKGPAAKMMRELDAEPSALGIVRHYGGQVDGWVIDRKDAGLARAIAGEGKAVLVTDTIMSDPREERRAGAAGGGVRAVARCETELNRQDD